MTPGIDSRSLEVTRPEIVPVGVPWALPSCGTKQHAKASIDSRARMVAELLCTDIRLAGRPFGAKQPEVQSQLVRHQNLATDPIDRFESLDFDDEPHA